jgi:hypothetical protein
LIDARVREHQTPDVLDHDDLATDAQHPPRFAQHQLDDARVLGRRRGEFQRPRRGRDVVQPDAPALALGDDLLCHHEDVVIAQRDSGASAGRDQECREIGILAHLGNAFERRDLEPGRGR